MYGIVGAQGMSCRSPLCSACSLGWAFGRTRAGLVSMGVPCRWWACSGCLRQGAPSVLRTCVTEIAFSLPCTSSLVYATRGMRAHCIVCFAEFLTTVKNESCSVQELVRRLKWALGAFSIKRLPWTHVYGDG